jgi:hypothetical protein
MARQRKTWAYSPPKPIVSDDLKAEVRAKAEALIEEFLKPEFIKSPPKNWRWNYIIDIHSSPPIAAVGGPLSNRPLNHRLPALNT